MATESPLFQSAMELLAHSITHFNGRSELDRKLFIIHIANAIELIFKDLILDSGESIYKNPKETITILGCIQSLKDKGIDIPFLNKIELLIDERNALQHRFGSPNELTTIFYMDITTEFFKELLHKYYVLDFDEVLEQFGDKKEIAAFKMREPKNESELEKLKQLSTIHPLGALLSAITYLERIVNNFGEETGIRDFYRRPYWASLNPRFFERLDLSFPEDLSPKVREVRDLRNLAAHGRKDPTKKEVDLAITTIDEVDKFLNGIDKALLKEKFELMNEEEDTESDIFKLNKVKVSSQNLKQ